MSREGREGRRQSGRRASGEWRYSSLTPALGAGARELGAAIAQPLRLEGRGRFDPGAESWGGPPALEELQPDLREAVAAGPRDAFELEQVVPGRDWGQMDDPILAAVELAGAGERERARGLLHGLLAQDPRCIDAHAHLGSLAFEYSAGLALPRFEAGIAVAERSLPAGFAGALPWGWIDSRPFLRCLHGYGLCLWRLGRREEAEVALLALLWLNPTDNQGVRDLLEPVRAGTSWRPVGRDERVSPGTGRRALLDAAAPLLDPAPLAIGREEAEATFRPLLWLLGRAGEEGLPLTQTGALARAIVREAAERFPSWWDAELFGPPHRQADLLLLEALEALARRSRLLRRRKGLLLLTARGRAAREDPDALLDALAPRLLEGRGFEREVAELACAALLVERESTHEALAAAVHGAVGGSWRTEEGPVTEHEVSAAAGSFLATAIAMGALSEVEDRRALSLSDPGAELLARALRHAATAARPGPKRPAGA